MHYKRTAAEKPLLLFVYGYPSSKIEAQSTTKKVISIGGGYLCFEYQLHRLLRSYLEAGRHPPGYLDLPVVLVAGTCKYNIHIQTAEKWQIRARKPGSA
jgi:hypothetical protein